MLFRWKNRPIKW